MVVDDVLGSISDREWHTTQFSDPTPVRVAVIGLGWWTREQAIPALTNSTYCTPTVAVDQTADTASDVARTTDTITHALTSDEFHAGHAADAYDAVYICTPNNTHHEYVTTAVELEKDILCEKPVEATLARARDLVTTCTESESTLMIGYRLQTHPLVRQARTLLRNGRIGTPVHVHAHMSQRLLEMIPDPDQWRLTKEIAGGGALPDLGVYPINTTRFLLDETPTAVTATTRSEHEAFTDVDEHVSCQAEFPSATTALWSASQHAAKTSSLEVIGTDGRLQFRPAFTARETCQLTVSTPEQTGTFAYDEFDQMREEFDYFGYCLLTDTPPDPTGQHALTDMAIINAIYTAANTHARVQIPTPRSE